MTGKRFVHKNESIINIQTDELVNAGNEDSAEIITAWLNELFNDYTNLKKENYGNLDGLNYYQEQNGYLESRISDLECENEELKRRIGNLEHTRDFCADVCADCERLEKENEELKSTNMEYEDALGRLEEKNEELKQSNKDAIQILKKEFDFANEQRQKHLDDLIVVRAYDIIRYDMRNALNKLGDYE